MCDIFQRVFTLSEPCLFLLILLLLLVRIDFLTRQADRRGYRRTYFNPSPPSHTESGTSPSHSFSYSLTGMFPPSLSGTTLPSLSLPHSFSLTTAVQQSYSSRYREKRADGRFFFSPLALALTHLPVPAVETRGGDNIFVFHSWSSAGFRHPPLACPGGAA